VVRALLALLPCAAGCSPDGGAAADPVACAAGFLGDASSPADFEITAVSPDYVTEPLADGGTISLMQPPQGGQVLFVGVRATNVDSCGLALTSALRDEATQQVRFDMRTINLIAADDGWGVTGPIGGNVTGLVSNFANVPVCANEWSSTDVNGHVYGLEVTLTDRSGRTLVRKIQVTPECNEPLSAVNCACICRAGYSPTSPCPAPPDDAGADDAGPDDGGGE
jgi:hypothetical protein